MGKIFWTTQSLQTLRQIILTVRFDLGQGWQYSPARVFPPRENPGKPGLGNNAFLAKVCNNGQ